MSARRPVPDVLVVGTDPILSVLVAVVWKHLRPHVRIAHWAFDLYPEAAIADGLLDERSLVVRTLRRCLQRAYARCDLIADLGPCMRERLERYDSPARRLTLVPWALAEPDSPPSSHPSTRRELFGEASLGLLYSGNFGRAHSFEPFLALARDLRPDAVHLTFGVRGNRAEELRRAIGSAGAANVSIAGFAPEAALATRLAAADIHLASLRAGWTGTVVPSKFFGSLAVGRPVLFAGPPDSAIARWIHELGVGWVLDDESRSRVCSELRRLAREPDRLRALQERCLGVYRERFSKRAMTAAWDRELRACLDGSRLTNP